MCLCILTIIVNDESLHLKREFISWPGIDQINFKKSLNNTEVTIKGQLNQEIFNLQLTKHKRFIPNYSEKLQDISPDKANDKTNELYYNIIMLGKINVIPI